MKSLRRLFEILSVAHTALEPIKESDMDAEPHDIGVLENWDRHELRDHAIFDSSSVLPSAPLAISTGFPP